MSNLRVLLVRDQPNRLVSGPLLRRGPITQDAIVIIPAELSLDDLVEVLARKVLDDLGEGGGLSPNHLPHRTVPTCTSS